MSKVEELLEKYNPDGVEDLTLGEICLNHDSKRRPISKGNRIPGNIPYYGANGIQDYVDDYLFNGEYILVGEDGSVITEEGTPIVKWVYGKFWVNNHAHIFSENLNKALLKYVFYILQINKIKDLVRGVPPKLTKESVLSISLKIPHIKVQEEIVKILDSFTNLIDALNEELSLRQKQFEYYREKLLTFDESNYVKISSICKRIVSGGTPKTTIDRYYQGNIPWLRTEEVDFCYVYETKKHISEEAIANSSTKMIPVNCVIIAMYGATAAKCCINKIPLCTNQACCNLEIDDTLALYKFVFYNICKEYEKLKSLGEGSQNNISGQKIKDYRIPIPSLAIQQSIVEKLDAFESIISSLKEEIALRQKQYEYYREKLLTFD